MPWDKKYFCVPPPPSTKITKFEVENRCKNAEEVKAEHLLHFISFDGNKTHLALETNSTKLQYQVKVITLGCEGGVLDAKATFTLIYFSKNMHF